MKNLKGMLLALAAGCCWGLSGTMGQYMFDIQHTDAAALAVIVLVGTVFAYTAFLHAASEIGSVPAALLASVEVVSAPFFSSLLLDSKFTVYDCGGFLCMLLMAVMLALPELRKKNITI